MNFPALVERPEPSEYAPYFQPYMDLAGKGSLEELLHSQPRILAESVADIAEPLADTVHPPFAWTLKQVVGHVIDTEKIFGCRAHCIACSEKQPLPGFDQNSYVTHCDYSLVPLAQLVNEFESVRQANCMLFQRLTDQAWSRTGVCDGKPISVRAIAYLLTGHFNHHLKIIEKRLK